VKHFKSASLFTDTEWSYVKADGTLGTSKGVYFIVDGGYHKWKTLICPYKYQPVGSDESRWSDVVESLRKDVECTFGIQKKRFLFFKHAIRLHDVADIENAFKAACVFHNILLEWDGKDDWEVFVDDDTDEEDADGFVMEEAMVNVDDIMASPPTAHEGILRSVSCSTDERILDSMNVDPDEEEGVDEFDFHTRREALITHYKARSLARSLNE